MPTRGLTSGELQILDFVFSDTIDFEQHEITTNDKNIGGADNSVTYSDTPHYSHQIWCADFSDPNADTWVFVHEFGHVWQYYYGVKPSMVGSTAQSSMVVIMQTRCTRTILLSISALKVITSSSKRQLSPIIGR
jgi:hypothetical protein